MNKQEIESISGGQNANVLNGDMIMINYQTNEKYTLYNVGEKKEFFKGCFLKRINEFIFSVYTISQENNQTFYKDLIDILPIYSTSCSSLNADDEEEILKTLKNDSDLDWCDDRKDDDEIYMKPKLYYAECHLKGEKTKRYLFTNLDEAIEFSKKKIINSLPISTDEIPF